MKNIILFIMIPVLSCSLFVETNHIQQPEDTLKDQTFPEQISPHTPVEIPSTIRGTVYYVDFQNGSDDQIGTSPEAAWKHAPGDSQATGNPLSATLEPGDAVFFRGGIDYYGSIDLPATGAEDNPIWFMGNRWGDRKAIINGSFPLTGWQSRDQNIFYTQLPPEMSDQTSSAAFNLHEYDRSTDTLDFAWTAQSPNPADPFFYDDHEDFYPIPSENLTLTSIRDPEVFNQTDPTYWNGSSLLIWTNPNRVVERAITGYSPETNTVTFNTLRDEAIYPDGRDQAYAIYNSLHALDQPGEFYVDFEQNRIYYYPRTNDSLDTIENAVTVSSREYGINLNNQSHMVIEGFSIMNHSGSGLRSGIGIGTINSSDSKLENIIIRENEISKNRHPSRGYGGIYLRNMSRVLIEKNRIYDNYRHRGIHASNSDHITLRGNQVLRPGSTGISFYEVTNSQITENSVIESKGGHANGITIYIASKNILIAHNRVIDSTTPVTFQDSGNLYFINNLIYSTDGNGLSEWSRTSRGPWTYGEVVLLNNTFYSSLSTQSMMYLGNSTTTFTTSEGETIYPNTYKVLNNIIDAGAVTESENRDYNLYSSLAWYQDERYDWYLSQNEREEQNLSAIFMDHLNGDFRLPGGSPAKGAGTDVSLYLPTGLFPVYDFNRDIDQNPRPGIGPWSIGAYE